MLQTLEFVALVPVALVTVVNACSVVTVRPLGGGRRLDAHAAIWSALVPPVTQMSMSFEPTATAHIAPPVRRPAPARETPTQPHAMAAAEAHPSAPALRRPQPVTEPVEAKRAGRPGTGRQQLSELRAALADGWEIVQPIFARPLWSAPDDSATAFNFVLRSPRGTRLITVPQGRPVERFIRDRHLTVDYAR
ncbi:MAG: hypothetical protein PVSMB4_12450 [Ktedonobacterales bacterium]